MLDDDRREYILNLLERVREIGALDDESAYSELIGLINEIKSGSSWAIDAARDELAKIREQAKHFSATISHAVEPETWWSGQYFLDKVEEVGRRWPDDVREHLAGDIAEVRHTAAPVARSAAEYGVVAMIRSYATRSFANVQEGERMFRDLVSGEELLTRLGKLADHAGALRVSRERLVRYRWSKRLEEAEVAEAGGNSKKALKLRNEAKVLLKQDWLRAFPSESPPEV